MGKGKILVCLFSIVALCMTGCGKDTTAKIGEQYIYNKTTDLSSIQTITGEKPKDITTNENWHNDKINGVSVKYTDTMNRMGDQLTFATNEYGGVLVFDAAETIQTLHTLEDNQDSMSEDEMIEKLNELQVNGACYLYCFFMIPDSEQDEIMETMQEWYQNIEELGRYEQGTCVFAYNTDFSKIKTLTSEEATLVKNMVEEREEIFQSICFYEGLGTSAITGGLSKFSAETLDGETLNQSIFADYDLTVVNVWATWCGPCVNELPELKKLSENLPDNVNFISICLDGDIEGDLAREIVQTNDITYPTLIPNEEMRQAFLNTVYAWPTTVYLDHNGNLVGEPTVGVPSADSAEEAYQELIEEHLQILK